MRNKNPNYARAIADFKRANDQLWAQAFEEIKRRAIVALKRNKSATSFCMAMGSASFHFRNGDSVGDHWHRGEIPISLRPTFDAIDQFSDLTGHVITGTPLKISSLNGEIFSIRTDW